MICFVKLKNRWRGGLRMDLIYDEILPVKGDYESAYEVMVFRGNRFEELQAELLENCGDLPSLGLYNESLYFVTPGARYRGDINVSLTRSGNTRVRQYLSINC